MQCNRSCATLVLEKDLIRETDAPVSTGSVLRLCVFPVGGNPTVRNPTTLQRGTYRHVRAQLEHCTEESLPTRPRGPRLGVAAGTAPSRVPAEVKAPQEGQHAAAVRDAGPQLYHGQAQNRVVAEEPHVCELRGVAASPSLGKTHSVLELGTPTCMR